MPVNEPNDIVGSVVPALVQLPGISDGIHVADPAGFTHLLAGHIGRLAPAGVWLKVFWSSTTFPSKPKLKAGETGRFTRSDWILYQAILASRREFSTLPLFSDYALEYPGEYDPIRVAPTAHIRYSTERDYIIFKGHTTRKPYGYKAIFSVANCVLSSNDFKGATFSAGDAYISSLAEPGARTGNASIWRWASTDHHFRMIHSSLGTVFGLPEAVSETAGNPEQLLLV